MFTGFPNQSPLLTMPRGSLEMVNEFTGNTFPFRFTIPLASSFSSSARAWRISGRLHAEPAVPAFEHKCSTIYASYISTANLLPRLPQVPAKAARTVRPNGIFFKVVRFFNLNLVSKRFKFRFKIFSENRC